MDNFQLTNTRGNILLENGKLIGKHEGVWNYTIGQRKNIDVSLNKDLYVIHIDAENNTLTVGAKDKLLVNSALLKDCNFAKYKKPSRKLKLRAKFNYKSPLVDCTFNMVNDMMKLDFMKPVHALAPGQSIVLYEGDDLVAGGVIV